MKSIDEIDYLSIGTIWFRKLIEALIVWKTKNKVHSSSIYGTGETAAILIAALERSGIDCERVYHRSPNIGNFAGKKLLPLNSLKKSEFVMIASSQRELSGLVKEIEDAGSIPILLSEVLRSSQPKWLWIYDCLPVPFQRIFYSTLPSLFWDGAGKRWAEKAHKKNVMTPQNKILNREISKLKPLTILEVGCGTGRMLEPLLDECRTSVNIVGCDLSFEMLSRARNEMNCAKLLQADITSGLPFADKSFELVYLIAVLQHIQKENLDFVLNEIIRVAKKNVIHWEYRWPKEEGFIFDHDLISMYKDRGYIVQKLEPGESDCFPDNPERCQFFKVELS